MPNIHETSKKLKILFFRCGVFLYIGKYQHNEIVSFKQFKNSHNPPFSKYIKKFNFERHIPFSISRDDSAFKFKLLSAILNYQYHNQLHMLSEESRIFKQMSTMFDIPNG